MLSEDRPRRSDEVADLDAQAKRRERRRANVDAGIHELERWLDDMVAGGLAAARQRTHASFDEVAARLVDAQAAGLAGRVRGLSSAVHGGVGWPDRTLAEMGELHLLIEAWPRIGDLLEPLAAQVRTQIGFPTSRGDVLAGPAWSDRWDVLAAVVVENPDLTSRRVWLQGRTVGGWALLLDHVPPGGQFEAGAEVGSSFEADLHRYPGAGSHRVLIGERRGETEAVAGLSGCAIADALVGHALGVAQNPWVRQTPMALDSVVPVDGDSWVVADEEGSALPLVGPCWPLLALSGGNPVGVFGEWDGSELLPLSCWADGALVRLV